MTNTVPLHQETVAGEELFAPDRWLFFKNHWPMEPHNADSVGKRSGKQPRPIMQAFMSSPGSQVRL